MGGLSELCGSVFREKKGELQSRVGQEWHVAGTVLEEWRRSQTEIRAEETSRSQESRKESNG